MTAIIAYVGLGLLVVKGIAPFFSTIRTSSPKDEIDESLGFKE